MLPTYSTTNKEEFSLEWKESIVATHKILSNTILLRFILFLDEIIGCMNCSIMFQLLIRY